MTPRLFFVLVIFLSCIRASAQFVPDLSDPGSWINLHVDSNTQHSLFNQEIMRDEKVRKAVILKVHGKFDADGVAEYQDTLMIYYFNHRGAIIQKKTYPEKKVTDPNQKALTEWPKNTTFRHSVNDAGDSMVQICTFIKSGRKPDTAYVIIETYDVKRRMTSYSRESSRKHEALIGCGGFHEFKRYEYDSLGRTTFTSNTYGATSIEYHLWGAKVIRLNNKSSEPADSFNIFLACDKNRMSILSPDNHIIRDYYGPKLHMITSVDLHGFSMTHYQFIYVHD